MTPENSGLLYDPRCEPVWRDGHFGYLDDRVRLAQVLQSTQTFEELPPWAVAIIDQWQEAHPGAVRPT